MKKGIINLISPLIPKERQKKPNYGLREHQGLSFPQEYNRSNQLAPYRRRETKRPRCGLWEHQGPPFPQDRGTEFHPHIVVASYAYVRPVRLGFLPAHHVNNGQGAGSEGPAVRYHRRREQVAVLGPFRRPADGFRSVVYLKERVVPPRVPLTGVNSTFIARK